LVDIAENDYYPMLASTHEKVTVEPTLVADDVVYQLFAVDRDTNLTCGGDDLNCPCSQVSVLSSMYTEASQTWHSSPRVLASQSIKCLRLQLN